MIAMKSIRKALAFLSFALLFTGFFCKESIAQIIIEETPEENYTVRKFGPNRLHYLQTYISIGMPASAADGLGSEINYWSSFCFDWGIRYKLKASEVYSAVADLTWIGESYDMKQTSYKSLPTNQMYDEESLNLQFLSLRLYNRFNFDKRGNHLGYFLDMGVYGDLLLASNHTTSVKLSDDSKISVIHSRLPYVNRWQYGLAANLGYHKMTLFGRYRFSNIIRSEYPWADPPHLWLGLQVALF